MTATTIQIDEDKLNRVDNIAKTLNRSRSWVINQAVEHFLSFEEWFVKEVEEGLTEVDRGEIASHDEVVEKFRKWGANAS